MRQLGLEGDADDADAVAPIVPPPIARPRTVPPRIVRARIGRQPMNVRQAAPVPIVPHAVMMTMTWSFPPKLNLS